MDVELVTGGIAAIMPDEVTEDALRNALRGVHVMFSPATGRDNGSVWLLSPRAVRIGRLLITSDEAASGPDVLALNDSAAFGTGHHPTTALCVEAIEEILALERIASMLDVGTGSGILALAALMMGVSEAVGVDIDSGALKSAADNARLNKLADRLRLVAGGPDAVDGTWPLVAANVLPAPLIEMAPILVRRVALRGRLILAGIPCSVAPEVQHAYQHLGMRAFTSRTRAGWTALICDASW